MCHSHYARLPPEPPGLFLILPEISHETLRNPSVVQSFLGNNAHLITVLESIIKLLPAITFTIFSSGSKEKGAMTAHVRGNKQYIIWRQWH